MMNHKYNPYLPDILLKNGKKSSYSPNNLDESPTKLFCNNIPCSTASCK